MSRVPAEAQISVWVSERTVSLRKRFIERGRLESLNRPSRDRNLMVKARHVIALACRSPREWTLQLMNSLMIVASISHEAFKCALRPHRQQYWVSHRMKTRRSLRRWDGFIYQRPEDPAFPVVAMDGKYPRPRACDRTCGLRVSPKQKTAFLFTAPFQGYRHVSVRERRTDRLGGGSQAQHLSARVTLFVIIIYINLPPCIKHFRLKAQRLESRLELVHTPKLGVG